ncbi:hypothetical protein DPMN_145603 [Dreissena polymorpha]|uniref:Uncharacterized protein n=1 Tax=Dreissena polymorpha TaxID=45954 RepID=A0A9D4F582_DREPO|nr:hypothetical protein DPMN_145603 [Dreissena polymorpha]
MRSRPVTTTLLESSTPIRVKVPNPKCKEECEPGFNVIFTKGKHYDEWFNNWVHKCPLWENGT